MIAMSPEYKHTPKLSEKEFEERLEEVRPKMERLIAEFENHVFPKYLRNRRKGLMPSQQEQELLKKATIWSLLAAQTRMLYATDISPFIHQMERILKFKYPSDEVITKKLNLDKPGLTSFKQKIGHLRKATIESEHETPDFNDLSKHPRLAPPRDPDTLGDLPAGRAPREE
jgi:hypothetical protein